MRKHRTLAFAFLLAAVAGYMYYYRYLDTLMLSQIIRGTREPVVDILIDFLDFDTGLTRNDLHHIARKSDYWLARIQDVESIEEPGRKKIESEKLMAEMLRDPTLRKAIRKIFGAGTEAAVAILTAASRF